MQDLKIVHETIIEYLMQSILLSVTQISFCMQHSATAEDRRIRELQEEKDRKLKKFQDEVRLRVQKLEKHKHQQQLLKSYQAVCELSNSNILMNW